MTKLFNHNFGNIIVYFCIFSILFNLSHADHFRYGAISWDYRSTTSYFLRIKTAFSLAYMKANNLPYTVGQGFSYGNLEMDADYPATSYQVTDMKFTVMAVHNQTDLVICINSGLVYNISPNDYLTYWYATNGVRQSNLLNNAQYPFYLTTDTNIMSSNKGASSPVSGIYPIIDMYYGSSNTYQMIATDKNSLVSQLKFSLSPSVYWTNEYDAIQPPGLTITSAGLISFSPGQIGLYSCQVRVTDPSGTWTSVDFLINSRALPTTPFPQFQSPTPAVGSMVTAQVGSVLTVDLSGFSPDPTISVYILVSDLHIGMSLTSQVGTNPATMSLKWNPQTDDIGNFIVNLMLIDSNGVKLSYGSHAFIIQVIASNCNQGTQVCTSGVCQCNCSLGWTGAACDQCASNTYGSSCLITDTCVHGTANTGPTGNGKCLCDAYWTGQFCNVSLIQSCSPSTASSILGNTSNPLFNPSIIQAYLSPVNTPELSIPLVITSPSPTINLLFLVDVTASSTLYTRYQAIKTSFSNFFTSIQSGSLYIGMATFSDSSNIINSFSLISTFKRNITNEMSNLMLSQGEPLASYPYVALGKAASNLQWSSNALNIILMITDNNLAGNQSDIDNAISLLKANNILLGVMGVDSVSNYDSFFTSLGYGRSAAWTTAANWYTTMTTSVYSPLLTDITIIKKSDPYGFVGTAPANYSSGVTSFSSTIRIPAGATTTNPSVVYQIVGYGKQVINVQYNHPPVTSPGSLYTTKNGNDISFVIQAYDPDLNILQVSFPSLPSLGMLYASTGSVIAGNLYPITTQFTFKVTPNMYGTENITFQVTDGCSTIPNLLTVDIKDANSPPSCTDTTITTNQVISVGMVVSGQDIDGDSLSITFPSLAAISSMGKLQSSGVDIVPGNSYLSPTTLLFIPLSTSNNNTGVVPFIVSDGTLTSQCSLTIVITRTNTPPVLQIDSPQTTIPLSIKNLTFTFSDADAQETVTARITSITPNGGQFSDVQGQAINSVPYSLGSFDMTNKLVQTSFIFYSSSSQSPNTASFTLAITDSANQTVSKVVEISVVGNRTNSPPSPTYIPPMQLLQGSETPVFYLNGTDPDTQYDSVLTVSISSMPTYGQLLLANDTVASSTGQTPLAVKYKPNASFYGNDQIVFNVIDTLGVAGSNSMTVYFSVSHVNHAPTLTVPNVFIDSSQNQSEITLIANDIDGDTLIATVISVPQYGSLFQSDGVTPISSGNTNITDPQFTMLYIPPVDFYYSFNTTYTVKLCDNFSIPACVSKTGNINFTYTNVPPVSYSMNITMLQSTSTTVVLNVTDQEMASPNARFTSLPTHGKLTTQDGQAINSSYMVVPATVIYTPDPTMSDKDTPGGLGPLETIFYVAHDNYGEESTPSTINVFVTPASPPTYTGPSTIETQEDTPVLIPIKADPGSEGHVYLSIVQLQGTGSLNISNGIMNDVITQFPYNITDLTLTSIWYTPKQDATGVVATLVFYLYDLFSGPNNEIGIISIPVNDIPVVTPKNVITGNETYQLANLISMDVNSSMIITWDSFDVDSNDVVSFLAVGPSNGTLYQFNSSKPNFIGAPINANDNIPRSIDQDHLFKMVFVGIDGVFQVNFSTFGIALNDGFNNSEIYMISVNVKPINTAPILNIPKNVYHTDPKVDVEVDGITVGDLEASQSNASVIFSVTLTGSEVSLLDTVLLPQTKPSCHYPQGTQMICQDTITGLNQILSTIVVHINNPGVFVLNVVINDTGLDFPGVPALTNQSKIEIDVSAPPTQDAITNATKPKKDYRLMIALIVVGAVLVLAIVAFVIYKLSKRNKTLKPLPNSAAFGGSFNISSNPLYNTATATIKANKKLKKELSQIN